MSNEHDQTEESNFLSEKRITLETITQRYAWFHSKDKEEDPTQDDLRYFEDKAREIYDSIDNGRKRVLLIKDGVNIDNVVGAMRREHFNVTVCENDEEKIQEILLSSFYSVVISCGPRTHSLEEAKRISEPVRTILLNCHSESTEIHRSIVDAYIPPNASAILDVITDLLVEYEVESARHGDYKVGCNLLMSSMHDVEELEGILSRRIDFGDEERAESVQGEAQHPGAVTGKIYANVEAAMKAKQKGEKVIVHIADLNQVTPKETQLIVKYADGVTCKEVPNEISHFAIDIKSAGMPMVGIGDSKVEEKHETAKRNATHIIFGNQDIKEGTTVTIDGTEGRVYLAEYPIEKSPIEKVMESVELNPSEEKELGNFVKAMDYADRALAGKVKVTVNADTVDEIDAARSQGVSEVSLVRSENLLKESYAHLRAYGEFLIAIKTGDETFKKSRRAKFREMQSNAFYKILKKQCEDGKQRRTQIRLLDPPFSEFFDHDSIKKIRDSWKRESYKGKTYKKERSKINAAANELTQMLDSSSGIRGVRLGTEYPDVYETQVKALFDAYRRLVNEGHEAPKMVVVAPYVTNIGEVKRVKQMLEDNAGGCQYEMGVTLETPTSLIIAPELVAMGIRNFTFGTNDLFTTMEAEDGRSLRKVHERYEMNSAIPKGMIDCVTKMYQQANKMHDQGDINQDAADWLYIGICGEMNPTKLENLKDLIILTRENVDDAEAAEEISMCDTTPLIKYVSAGRPLQVPVIKWSLATIYAKEELNIGRD